jgi:hypothetical protein
MTVDSGNEKEIRSFAEPSEAYCMQIDSDRSAANREANSPYCSLAVRQINNRVEAARLRRTVHSRLHRRKTQDQERKTPASSFEEAGVAER